MEIEERNNDGASALSRYSITTVTVTTIVLLLTLLACDPAVPDGRIRIKNDSGDKEFNVLKVSSSGSSCTLSPGETCLLSAGTRTISFSRQYKDYTRRYSVTCPPIKGKGIQIKLIDVHVNRIAGGCVTTSASKG